MPTESRSRMSSPPHRDSAMLDMGRTVYAVNCAHCHGPTGTGDGKVAGFLLNRPTNLHAPHVAAKPEAALYAIVSEGIAVMPSFKGTLSVEERWAVVYHVKSWTQEEAG